MNPINKTSLKILRRESDSVFTKLFARSLSAHISVRLAQTKVTPLQVTIISLLFGLAAAWIGSRPHYHFCIIAAIFMELSHVLDCVDGELARLTPKGNRFSAFMDPISDRFKDIAVLIASYAQNTFLPPFGLTTSSITFTTLITLGLWLCYMYIVDAFLNPVRKQHSAIKAQPKLYLGLYDLFIYGSITFWLINRFNYFIFFILFLSIFGIVIQIIRLKKILTPNQIPPSMN
jgi:phosphatidylglycerophosphate synthase